MNAITTDRVVIKAHKQETIVRSLFKILMPLFCVTDQSYTPLLPKIIVD